MERRIATMNPPKLSVFLLKSCLFVLSLGLLGLAGYAIPTLLNGIKSSIIFEKPGYVVLIVAYIALIPLMTSIFHGFRILSVFTKRQDTAIRISSSSNSIKKAFLVIAVLAVSILPVFFYIGQLDDAPGLVLVGISIVIIPLAISAFFNCMQYMMKKHIVTS